MADYREILISPRGREVAAGSPAEVNDLLARGYTRKDGGTENWAAAPSTPPAFPDS